MASKKNHNIDTEQNIPGEKIEESFDLTGLLMDYLNNWKSFIFSVVVCLGIAYAYLHTVVPTYKVGAAVYLNDDNATRSSVVSMSGSNPLFDTKNVIDETEIEILKSRNSLMKIVDTLQLAYSYSQVGKWRDVPIYKRNPITARMDTMMLNDLDKYLELQIKKDASNKYDVTVKYGGDYEQTTLLDSVPGVVPTPAGEVYLTPNGDFIQDIYGTNRIVISNPSTVAARLAQNLNVHYAANSATIVNFDYVTPLPTLGSDIIEMIIYFYNEQILEDKTKAATQTEDFIQKRLAVIRGELNEVEETQQEYREKNNLVNQDLQNSMAINQQSSAKNNLTELELRLQMVNEVLAEVRAVEVSAMRSEIQLLPEGLLQSAGLNSAIEKFNKNVNLYNTNRKSMTEEQEIIVQYISNLRDQKNQLIRSLEAEKKVLEEQRRNIQSLESSSTVTLTAQPSVDRGYQEILRDKSVKEAIYIFLLQKREEIALEKTLATPTAQFIDDPSVIAQVEPQTMKVYTIWGIIGLLIPALLIFLRRMLFPKFKDKADIERITSVPVIGEISKADVENSDIIVEENVSTSAAELFRLLRNNINFARTGGDKQVILLTSAVSGEGKTFVSLNLAMTYALTGKRVVIVGLDIRRPVLARKLGLSNRMGLTSYLSDQTNDVNEIVYPTDLNPNLFAVPAGPIPPNPNELLLSKRMDEFFNQLRQEFEYIIVDTAPIGLVSDTLLIIPHSDIQLFVTRARYSTRKGLHVLHEAINSGQIEKPYIILNGVNLSSRTYQYRRYGAYYVSKSYGYGYGYGKDSKKRKKKRFWRRNK